MRRMIGVAVAGLLALAASGCVAVSAKNNRWARDLDAVVVDDQIPVVNLRTGQVAKVDKAALTPIGQLTDVDDDCE